MRAALLLAALVACAAAFPCGPCDAAACSAAPCLPGDPFYCETGLSKGGCAASATAWNNTHFCGSCCSLATCKPRFHCDHKCPLAICQAKGRCGIADNYQCLSGASTGGCSANATFWPAQHMCDSCCDVTSCEFTCPPCTTSQCAATPCTTPYNGALYPFTCTSGPLKNGCSNSSSYFPDQSQCFSCCDSTACPKPTAAPSSRVHLA